MKRPTDDAAIVIEPNLALTPSVEVAVILSPGEHIVVHARYCADDGNGEWTKGERVLSIVLCYRGGKGKRLIAKIEQLPAEGPYLSPTLAGKDEKKDYGIEAPRV